MISRLVPNTTFGPYQGRRALSADSFSEHGGVVTVTADGESASPTTDFVGPRTGQLSCRRLSYSTIHVNVIRRASDDRSECLAGVKKTDIERGLRNDIHGAGLQPVRA